jgi:hypothetical protein
MTTQCCYPFPTPVSGPRLTQSGSHAFTD